MPGEDKITEKLKVLREQLDKLDSDIVTLLNKRADLVIQVRDAKKEDNISIYSASREKEILDRVVRLAGEGNFPKASIKTIFINIVSATRSLIGELSVVYLGDEFSQAHEASRQQFGEAVNYQSKTDVKEIISMIESGNADYGVLPIESNKSHNLQIIANISFDSGSGDKGCYVVVGK